LAAKNKSATLSIATGGTASAVPPASPVPPIPVQDAPPVAIPFAAFQQVANDNQPELSMSTILAYVKNLRKDKDKCEQDDV
jgi:hypothetical protein